VGVEAVPSVTLKLWHLLQPAVLDVLFHVLSATKVEKVPQTQHSVSLTLTLTLTTKTRRKKKMVMIITSNVDGSSISSERIFVELTK
jgi:hypothetical protein